jgi:rubrerythrin
MPETSQDHGAGQTPEGTQAPKPQRPAPATETTELPGDSVCWLRLVCPECGTMAESEPPTTCPQCGAPLPADR